MDERKLFTDLGYDSLFYCVFRDLGFSEAYADERIRAMRPARRLPVVRKKLESGSLSLTNAA